MATIWDPLRLVVGDKAAKRLDEAFGMHTVGDLLGHYPRRYASRGELTKLDKLREGDHVTVMAEVAAVSSRRMRNRPGTIMEAIVTDGRDRLTLTFFGRGRQDWREKDLQPGTRGLFSGQVSSFRGRRQLAHPDFVPLGAGSAGTFAAEYAAEKIPIYRATSKLPSWRISDVIRVVLDVLDVPDDPIPAEIRRQHGLCGYGDALRGIHRPVDTADENRAKKRLKWDEALVLQIALAQRRRAAADYSAIPRPLVPGGLLDDFDATLPFTLTDGQRLAGTTIAGELARDHPMNRLLQGEVGSGKTIIAVRAMLQAVDAAGQAVLLAPTEVLAQQHFRSITSLLGPLGQAGQLGGADHATRITLLTGSLGAAARRRALLEAASGAAGIVIGTHALLEDRVQFADLGLVVIDEQHRFGVEQRDALRDKAGDGRPHVLVMTATPIPRTVAMTVFGDLDISTLTELPAGRQPISTHVVPAAERPNYLARTWTRIREEVARGRQAYVVCPRIGDGPDGPDGPDVLDGPDAPAGPDALDDPDALNGPDGPDASGAPDGPAEAGPVGATARRAASAASAEPDTPDDWGDSGELGEDSPPRPPVAVLDLAAELARGPLAGLRLGIMHGRLPPEEKDKVMLAFADGAIDVLITTTVIEVGVDVPNATVMAIMDAERFGVSQLHQLRGRVGRGGHEGLCLLVTDVETDSPARERLDAVAGTSDGFELSRIDLRQRREGNVLGTAQAGRRTSLKILSVIDDEDLIARARAAATGLVDADLALVGYPALADAVAVLVENERSEYLEKA